MAVLDRGELWLVDLGYAAKTRPCMILSIPALDTDRALSTVVPYTSQIRGTRFEVAIATRHLNPGAFDAQNPTTVPHAKFRKKLGVLDPDQVTQVEDAVKSWLGL